MINAETAQQQTLAICKRRSDRLIKRLERKINRAIKRGKFYISIAQDIDIYTKAQLEELDYKVERHTEQMNTAIVSYYVITWE